MLRSPWWLGLVLVGCVSAPGGENIGGAPAAAAVRLGLPAHTVLPMWARQLSASLPATTQRLLSLDVLHRSRHPLGVGIAAAVRQEAAARLRCQAVAAAAARDLGSVPAAGRDAAAEAAARTFAAAMIDSPREVPAEVFEAAVARFGPDGVMSLVHTVAYTNFQCRLLTGLGDAGDQPLVQVPPEWPEPTLAAPVRGPGDGDAGAATAATPDSFEVGELAPLAASREVQQRSVARLPPPPDAAWERLDERERRQARRIVWSRYGYGYQPDLTRAWFACLHTFYGEARVDPVQENAVFWVVTRTHGCFY